MHIEVHVATGQVEHLVWGQGALGVDKGADGQRAEGVSAGTGRWVPKPINQSINQ